MLDWTGERYLPWIGEAAIAYEHLHRYFYAAQFVKGKRVLDLASGEGYGANRLAATARQVTGIDIDPDAVRHASAKYSTPNLQYLVGSISEIPLADRSFDVVTCFEAIEHIDAQTDLLREVRRVLAPDGIFLVSTPNKSEYQHEGEANPFHVKELSPEEFQEALRKQFRNIQILGQRIHSQSSLWQMGTPLDGRLIENLIHRTGSEFASASQSDRIPIYIIAIASNVPLPKLDSSVLVDISDQLVRQKDSVITDLLASKTANEESIEWLTQQMQARDEHIVRMEEGQRWQAGQIEGLKQSVKVMSDAIEWQKRMINDGELIIRARDEALKWRAEQVNHLENEIALLNRNLEIITNSAGWKWILRFCALRDRLCPKESRRRQLLSRLLAR